MQKTLRGSSEDIGWLQNSPGMAPVEDGTARFMKLLEGIRYHLNWISSRPYRIEKWILITGLRAFFS